MKFRTFFSDLSILPALLCSSFCLYTNADCQPFIPTSDSQILETIPSSTILFKTERSKLTAVTTSEKPDLDHTVSVVKDLITQGRQNADPRAISYAKSLLSPWQDSADPPMEISLLRAAIEDHQHNFKAALGDFDVVLKKDPHNLQALISTASVYAVLGELDKSRETCAKTLSSNTLLLAATCAAAPASLQGKGRKVYDALEGIVVNDIKTQGAVASEINWAAGLLAEIAERLGINEGAEKWFAMALQGSPDDAYLLGAYADFLLDRREFSKVIELLQNHRAADPLLLRLAIAEAGADDNDLLSSTKDLSERFDSERARLDSIHRREETRFQLELKHDAPAALKLAEENWDLQKEPIDLLLLAAAAKRTNDVPTLQLIETWRQRWIWEDVRLDQILHSSPPTTEGDVR